MWTCYTFTEDSHNTGNFIPYSFRIVCGSFDVPRNCEHSRVVRRGLRFIVLIRGDLKVLTICRCNYKGSTFSSFLRPWVLVRPEPNSRPPDLPHGKPLLNQLSHRSAVNTKPCSWRTRTQATGRSFTYVAVKTWKKLDCWQRSSVLRDFLHMTY